MAAPGAPLIGVPVPVKIPPSPSPSHHTVSDHTIVPASAALTLRRHSRPTASSSWMVANAALKAAVSCPISWLDSMTGLARSAGLPMADGLITWLTNDLLNINGWYCNAASSSQAPPRAICSARRPPAIYVQQVVRQPGNQPVGH